MPVTWVVWVMPVDGAAPVAWVVWVVPVDGVVPVFCVDWVVPEPPSPPVCGESSSSRGTHSTSPTIRRAG